MSIIRTNDAKNAWWQKRYADALGDDTLKHLATAHVYRPAILGYEEVDEEDESAEDAEATEETKKAEVTEEETQTFIDYARELLNGILGTRVGLICGMGRDESISAIFRSQDPHMVFNAQYGGGHSVSFQIYGESQAACERVATEIEERIDSVTVKKIFVEENIVPIAFWRMGRRLKEAVYDTKDIECPSFDEIQGNYPAFVTEALETVFKANKPDQIGKIILWHGPPGLGKTYAVRALARDWFHRLKATVEIVLDPENLFGDADYMHELLLSDYCPNRRRYASYEDELDDIDYDEEEEEDNSKPLRLVIVEDGAEFFGRKCRDTAGFARLLNLTDGIIGQGLRCIFLLTANEELGEIDPAVMRPGRCIQEVNFNHLSDEEVEAWFREKGREDLAATVSERSKTLTLAEMYSEVNSPKKLEVVASGRET
jgi:hypothetical protein